MSEAIHLHPWSLPLAATSALAIIAFVYARGWLSLRKTSPNLVPAWRLTAFMSGLFSVWIAAESPLATLDHQSLTMHMVKHLLLMTVAAALLLLGKPTLPLLHGLPRRLIQHKLVPKTWAARSAGFFLTHPVFCWLAGTMTVIVWHLPVVFELALRFHWVHTVENASFLLAGVFFWWPVVLPTRSAATPARWSMALYLFLATLPCDVLSAFLVFCGRVVYPSYLSAPGLFASPLQDQECAGALMWVFVTFAFLLPAVIITLQALSPRQAHSHEAWRASHTLPSRG